MEARRNSDRLDELRRLMVLDSAPERRYHEIAQRLGAALSAAYVMINLLDEDRDWIKASVGLVRCQTQAQKSMCNIFFETLDDVVLVEDTLLDVRFADHPFVTGEPKIRFYMAARLVSNGHTVGTLCAYDTEQKTLSHEQTDILRTLALEVTNLLVARKQALETLA